MNWDKRLRADVRLLGERLGRVLVEQEREWLLVHPRPARSAPTCVIAPTYSSRSAAVIALGS